MKKNSHGPLLLLAISLLMIPLIMGSQDPNPDKQLTGLVTSTTGIGGNHGVSSTQWLRASLGQPQPVGMATSNNYRLEAGFWPTTRGQSVSTVEDPLPEAHTLDQVYPNPFNPSVTVSYAVAQDSPVSVEIFDLRGQKVATLIDEFQVSGWYTVTWNGKSERGLTQASGVYLCRVSIGDFKDVKKLTLLQ